MSHLNTYKICTPVGTEKFDYAIPYVRSLVVTGKHTLARKGFFILPGSIDKLQILMNPEIMSFKGVTINYVIDHYIDWTDYTLYNTKHLSFHHLN